jgi:hypothetical protein
MNYVICTKKTGVNKIDKQEDEMKIIMRYWIKFYAPGSFTANVWIIECEELPKPEEVEIPENAYAFEIYKREDIEKDGKIYKGEAKQVGKQYYHPDSEVTTLEEVRKHPKTTDILISNMECNKWDSVIWTRWGNWAQPFNKEKISIVPKQA